MKNGKRPTVSEMQHIASHGLNSSEWLISKKQNSKWTLLHRESKQVKEIEGR